MTLAVKRAFLLPVVNQTRLIIRQGFFDRECGEPYFRVEIGRSGSHGEAAIYKLIASALVLGSTLGWMLARQFRLMGSAA